MNGDPKPFRADAQVFIQRGIPMSASKSGKRVLPIFVGDDYEDLELWYPKLRLDEAGAQVVVAGSRGQEAT